MPGWHLEVQRSVCAAIRSRWCCYKCQKGKDRAIQAIKSNPWTVIPNIPKGQTPSSSRKTHKDPSEAVGRMSPCKAQYAAAWALEAMSSSSASKEAAAWSTRPLPPVKKPKDEGLPKRNDQAPNPPIPLHVCGLQKRNNRALKENTKNALECLRTRT